MNEVAVNRKRRALVFDSGIGGLTVFAPIAETRPDLDLVYAADDAFFPYGALSEAALVARVGAVTAELIEKFSPDLVVIACNTASTLVLAPLRAAYPALPFVGTVPAIKPAAEASQSRIISVLATPGTVARDYTRALLRDFAGDCDATLVGAPKLAALAERFLRGEPVNDSDIAREIAPCFVERDGRRTDQIVLACTHFPILIEPLRRLAPWPVTFVDPAPAIARRVDALLGPGAMATIASRPFPAVFTSGRPPSPKLQKALRRLGLTATSAGERAPAV
ncbi:MAG: glutamate racemase [Bradyrhizobium sp.]|nr:MAG: glutamate racemase [Bradyrhizobium sp.]